MKKLFTNHLIVIITAAVLLIATLTIALSLTMCDYEEPDLSKYGITTGEEQDGQVRSPYGMFDYSKRPFFDVPFSSVSIYNNDIYYVNSTFELMRIPLNDLSCDLRTSAVHVFPEQFTICPDVTHRHNQSGTSIECPDNLNTSLFLLDAYESAGDFPIIYYCAAYYAPNEPAGDWDYSETYDIYRYDTGKVEREFLVSMTDPVIQMMAYDQSLYFITRTAENDYELNIIAKSGGDVSSFSIGEGIITLLGVHNEQIVLRDADATIFKVDLDLQNSMEIYQIFEDLTFSMNADGFNTVFVHGEYLYYCADYNTVEYELNPGVTDQTIDLLKHSVRRLSLDDLSSEGEMVAENVLDNKMYSGEDDIFYYQSCEPGKTQSGYYWNFTGGQLKGVNLESLESVDINGDCGIEFMSMCPKVYGDAIIDTVFPIREGYNLSLENAGGYRCLYDIKTGSLYPLFRTG